MRRRWKFVIAIVVIAPVVLLAPGRFRDKIKRIARNAPGVERVEGALRRVARSAAEWFGLIDPPGFAIMTDPDLLPGHYAINLGQNTDWSTDGAWIDARNSLRRWGHPDRPWVEYPDLKLSEDGYPLSDAGSLSYLRGYPDGVYRLSFKGTARCSVGGMARLVGAIVTSEGRSTGLVQIDHSKHDLMTIKLTDIDPTDPIRDLRLIRPGVSGETSRVFADAFLKRLQPFHVVRVMDWAGVNTSDVREWSERVSPSSFLRTGPIGVSYEDMIALANESEKDLWITIPDGATDDHARRLAQLLLDRLDPKLRVYLELGNELWNQSFPQAKRLVASARDDPSLTREDDFGRAGEKAAKRLVEVAVIVRTVFGADSPRLIPVFAGQSANAYFTESGLRYLASHEGPPREHIGAIAIAPYLSIDPARDRPGLSLDNVFAAMDNHLNNDLSDWIARHAELARRYDLPLIAYEAGQHLTPWNAQARTELNVETKRAAQDDPRMGALYCKLNDVWSEKGGGLLAFYSLTSRDGKGGYWGLLTDSTLRGSVKWDAVMSIVLPAGDATGDGRADLADYALIARNLGKKPAFRADGDLDRDGLVDDRDLAKFRHAAGRMRPSELREVDAFIATRLGRVANAKLP